MQLGIAEILEIVSKEKIKQKKIEILRNNETIPLKQILQYCYAPNIKFLLPEGKVPYTPSTLPDLEAVFYVDARRLYLFLEVDGHPVHKELTQIRREILFIEMLETLSPKDAELLASIKDKKMPYKGVTEKLIKEAFPDILP